MKKAGETKRENPGGSASNIGRLLLLLRPSFKEHWRRLAFGFAALLVVDLIQLLIPRVMKRVIDGLEGGIADGTFLLRFALLILLMGISIALLRYLWRTCIIGFSRLLEQKIRNQLFAHILKMDLPFFEKRTTGTIMAHSSNDLSAVQMACGMGLVAAVDALLMALAAIGFMMAINVKLTLIALLPMPVLAVCTQMLSSRMHSRFTIVQEQFGELTEFARSTLVSLRLLKAYTMEQFQEKQFGRMGEAYVKSNLKVAVIQGLLHPVASLVGNLGMLLVLYYGGILVIKGTNSMGDFVAFITYLYMLVWPMMAVGWVANLVQRGLTSLDRIDQLFQAAPLLPQGGEVLACREEVPKIELRSLHFTYPGSDAAVLKGIDLEMQAGFLGVTGPTGGGKSSFCKLLARLYPVPDGVLFVDGQDVNSLTVDSVRDLIAYVGQEPLLFSETIRDNIRFGRPDCREEEVVAAAKLAGVHDDIMLFKDTYDALVGERGVTLSGGQRQRITLARALLCDAPVLLIDDGLSGVDVKTERQVIDGLRKHLTRKIVVIVSHRIRLLSETDRIIVIDEGRVIHDETHAQLLNNSSFYRSMHEKQTRDASLYGEARP